MQELDQLLAEADVERGLVDYDDFLHGLEVLPDLMCHLAAKVLVGLATDTTVSSSWRWERVKSTS